MSKKFILSILSLFIFLEAFSQTYIKDVTVIDVINQQLMPRQTVVLTNDQISAIGSVAEIEAIPGATVINGTGNF